MMDDAEDCIFCGGLEMGDDGNLPERFRNGVYDVKEICDNEAVQLHGLFHDGIDRYKVIYDPYGDLMIETPKGDCLHLTQDRIIGLLKFFVLAETVSDDHGT